MKLIVTDLDATLLHSDKSISDYTIRILEKCRETGNLIAFASARSEAAMERFIHAVKPDALISNGGAVVRVGDKMIFQNEMTGKEVATVLSMCRRFTQGRGLVTLDSREGYFCNFVPRDPDRYNGYVPLDLATFDRPAYKITAELERDEWGEEIVRACPGCTVIDFTGEIWRRFAAEGSDKGNALKILADAVQVPLCNVIAFGDDRNDLGMLKLAGHAVAVANAIDEVRAVADLVTESNDEDGVARFLERTLLQTF